MRSRRNKIENYINIESNSDYTNTEETECTLTTCTRDNNEDQLKCSDCSRLVHYECTQLPAYYISLILSKKKSHKFVCKELKLIADTEKQQSDMKDLKRKLQTEPSFHTTEYLEEKFEKRVTELGFEIRTSIIEELKAINNTDNSAKSYAVAAKKDQYHCAWRS